MPCIIEGETGVSKTALTRMFFVLKNQSSFETDTAEEPGAGLSAMQLRQAVSNPDATMGIGDDPVLLALRCIASSLLGYVEPDRVVPVESWNDTESLAQFMCAPRDTISNERVPQLKDALLAELKTRPGLLAQPGLWAAFNTLTTDHSALGALLVRYIHGCNLLSRHGTSWTFHQLNVSPVRHVPSPLTVSHLTTASHRKVG